MCTEVDGRHLLSSLSLSSLSFFSLSLCLSETRHLYLKLSISPLSLLSLSLSETKHLLLQGALLLSHIGEPLPKRRSLLRHPGYAWYLCLG